MSIKNSEIIQKTREIMPELIALRRELHRFPELGREESKTGEILVRELKKLGLSYSKGIADTGIVARHEGSSKRGAVALRADMDGLPVEEKTGLDFSSKNPGVMHACGHDIHMSVVLGVAMLLNKLNYTLPGNVVFIFQPSEEKPPGGAKDMIKEGVLEQENIKNIFALHVNPYLSSGVLGIRFGPIMASADIFEAKVIGKGGHGALPHFAVDSITIATSIIQSFQQIISRQIDPVKPAVLTVGTINGGEKFNIIPESVEFTGTVRTLSEKVREEIPAKMKEIGKGIANAHGADFEMEYSYGYPILNNHTQTTKLIGDVAADLNGEENVRWLKNPTMGSEDFSYFVEKIPGTYAFLGAKPLENNVYPWHSPYFVCNEEAIARGVELLTKTVLQYYE